MEERPYRRLLLAGRCRCPCTVGGQGEPKWGDGTEVARSRATQMRQDDAHMQTASRLHGSSMIHGFRALWQAHL